MKQIEELAIDGYEKVEIQGKSVWVPPPDEIPPLTYIERDDDLIDNALSAWMDIDGLPPEHFRLYGPPGVGKNYLIYKLAQILQKDLYILNGNEELTSEEIACSVTQTSTGKFTYVASPLFAAMLRGGIFFLDEVGKIGPSALNPLASVLDDRRTIRSGQAVITLKAHKDFLFCAALNDTEETGGILPEFIKERLTPAFYVDYPPLPITEKILRRQLSQADDRWFTVFMKEFKDKEISPRAALKILKVAFKMALRDGKSKGNKQEINNYLRRAQGKKYKNPIVKQKDPFLQKDIEKETLSILSPNNRDPHLH